MMEVKLLRIVVASPVDVQAERVVLDRVVDELNRGVAADRGLRLEVVRWETDAHPGFHPEGPQGLIDPIIRIEDSDILIGIFWKRFGTPTKDEKSGTEHEILKAYKRWQMAQRPDIMVYFNQESATPKSQEETEQWGHVLKFKRDFPKEGLWWDYDGPEAFGELVRNHLTRHIRRHYELPGQIPEEMSGTTMVKSNEIAEQYDRLQKIRHNELRKLAVMMKEEKRVHNQAIATETQLKENLAKWYKETFHDAFTDSEERRICNKVMEYLDQLKRWVQLLERGHIDRDILFNEIGAAFEIDIPLLWIVIDGHAVAHPSVRPYDEVKKLKQHLERWRSS